MGLHRRCLLGVAAHVSAASSASGLQHLLRTNNLAASFLAATDQYTWAHTVANSVPAGYRNNRTSPTSAAGAAAEHCHTSSRRNYHQPPTSAATQATAPAGVLWHLAGNQAAGALAHLPSPDWQRRLHSVAKPDDQTFVYKGPLATTVRRLKMLSLFSCVATATGAPLIVALDSAGSSAAAKAGIAITVCTFGLFTTGLLHWFSSPYVHRLAFDRRTDTVTVDTLSLLARPVQRSFPVQAVRYPDSVRPLTTFAVDGAYYYLDADNFADKQLLARLTPPDPAAAAAAPPAQPPGSVPQQSS